ncbi:MAG: glycosyltransferase family 2 protein [Bacteroidetes bacterium]|nr:glycosyltransferase family 2 protein [Bacteroidota bacterium]
MKYEETATALTIGMPVYNDVRFIQQSLESILNQTFQNFELIISDDGATDGSELICQKYAKKDLRIKYIRQPKNLGISKNMEFLYAQANKKYFMWAGDDDLIAPTFIEKLINSLENNPNAISAFCTFNTIDENGKLIFEKENFDYSDPSKIKRLKKFIKNSNDIFGYGIFLTKKIAGVKFPIWWWPNKKCPYNNIFPSLCFYLAKGNYIHNHGEPLFFKREKSQKFSNYSTPFSSNGLKDTLAFILRRFYLVCFSSKMITKGSGVSLALYFFPSLILHWFIIPSWQQFKLVIANLIKKSENK